MSLGLEALGTDRAIAMPQIDHGIGRGVVFLAQLATQCRGRLACDERPHRLQIEELFNERRGLPRGRLEQQPLRAGLEIGGCHQAVDEPHFECTRAAIRLALQHQVQGGPHAEQPHAPYRAAEPRMNAEHDLGQSEGELRVVGTDPVGAGERELETAAEGKALDGRNARKGQGVELIKHRLPGAHQRIALLGRADVDELLDVGAGYEAAALRRADDETDRLLRSDLGESGSQILDDHRRQYVGGAPRHVAGEPGDAIRIDIETPGAAHGVTPPPVPIRGS